MWCFHKGYFAGAVLLLAAEIVIAGAVHDAVVRPYGGDFLATIFLYCLLRSVTSATAWQALAGSLLASYLIEALQYVQLLQLLGLENVPLARTVLGSHFAWADVLAYTLGALAVLAAERVAKSSLPATFPGS
jgi:hypothetical protein